MAQNNNRGGNSGRGNQQRAASSNETITLQQQLQFVLGQIIVRKEEIAAVLPPDLPFDRFHATINQALRNNPEILKCTGVSIVNACVKSAYDGLRLDGKEAALVAHNVKVARNPDKWESQAEYFPMVRGLIKKILTSREVISIEAEVIYEHDTYRVLRGTNPDIHHEPRLVGDRGKPIAYYSIATLKGGHHSAEIMTAADVADVRKEAKTAFVWDRWPGEMGKKSVIRRHEKKLPSGRDMIDVEAMAMFPQYDRTTPHPSLAAPTEAAPRPTRAAIADQQGTEFGMSFGNQSIDDREDDREHVVVEQDNRGRQEKPREQQVDNRQQQRDPEPQLPEDEQAWAVWANSIDVALTDARDADAVDAVWNGAQPILKHASKAIRDRLTGKVTDRNADLVLEADDAGGSGED